NILRGVESVTEHTRRDFLKLSAAAASAWPATGKLWATTPDNSGSPSDSISVWTTDDARQLEQIPPMKWHPASGPAPENAVVLNPGKKFQEILGFGAAFTDAACYSFNRLDSSAREKLFHQLFHSSEMGFNVGRTCIGASDYSASLYSYDEGASDPNLD